MSPVRAAKGKDPALGRFLARLIQDYVTAGGQQSDLARRADVAPSLITQIKSRGEGAGHKSAPRIAEALGVDYPALWTVARAWWDETGGKGEISDAWLARVRAPATPPERFVELADRYPNRAAAVAFARRDGTIPEEAIASVMADELRSAEDPSPLWWLDQMRLREVMLRSAKRGELPGVEVKEEDVARPRGPRGRTK